MNKRQVRMLAVCSVLTSYAHLPLHAKDSSAQDAGPVAAVVAAPTPAKERIETEIVTLERGGATPARISRQAGPFYLRIENRIPNPANPVTAGGLELVNESGIAVPKTANWNALRQRRIAAGLVDLPPGDYQLRVSGSARVLCEIHIR